MAEIDILWGGRLAQARPLQPRGQALVLAVGGFAVHEQSQPLLEGEAGALGRLQLVIEGAQHAEEAQRFQLGERRVGQHGLVSSSFW